jgi:hypothetical protein
MVHNPLRNRLLFAVNDTSRGPSTDCRSAAQTTYTAKGAHSATEKNEDWLPGPGDARCPSMYCYLLLLMLLVLRLLVIDELLVVLMLRLFAAVVSCCY